jgi:hypothetical protein
MNPSPCRKRELSPLRRACLSLGLPVNAQPSSNHAWLLRRLGLGSTGIEYLRLSNDEPARRIVELYDSLNRTEQRAVTVDYLALATGTDIHRVWGLIQEELSRTLDTRAMLQASMRAADVIGQSIATALTPEGHQDRKLVLQATMLLPTWPTTPRLHLLQRR